MSVWKKEKKTWLTQNILYIDSWSWWGKSEGQRVDTGSSYVCDYTLPRWDRRARRCLSYQAIRPQRDVKLKPEAGEERAAVEPKCKRFLFFYEALRLVGKKKKI